MPPESLNSAFWDKLLKGVSRSFYLSIRALPPGMRRPVAAAYLLARAADTIADTPALPPADRLARLLAFRAQVRRPGRADDGGECDSVVGDAWPDAISRIVAGVRAGPSGGGASGGVTAAETALLDRVGGIFALYAALPEPDRARVGDVVVTLTRAMEMDLTTFPPENSGGIAALPSADDLDRYTYLAAGCVGEFWTAAAMAHQPRLSGWDAGRMAALGAQFGQALQLTNVLRDIPRDLRAGRCYLPAPELAQAGLDPADLLNPANAVRARPVLTPWLLTALEHFDAATAYLLATPHRCLRLRLAALWPILLGLATLEKLAANPDWLAPQRPARVRRRWVYWMLARSLPAAPSDTLLRYWIRSRRRQAERAVKGR